VTVHDLSFERFPQLFHRANRLYLGAMVRLSVRLAARVIAVSASTRRELVELLGVPERKIEVIPNGVEPWFRPLPAEEVARFRAEKGLPERFILHLGTLEPRKNIGALLDAYETLLARRPSAPRLVLAGRATPDAAEWLRRLTSAPLAAHASHLGYVPDEEQEALYAGARVLVLPSLDEGFGLPALAAMSAGVPVIASARGALPEVVGRGGTLIDPERPGELADALERIITDDQWAFSQGAAGLERACAFSWPIAAATLRRAYLDAVARRRART